MFQALLLIGGNSFKGSQYKNRKHKKFCRLLFPESNLILPVCVCALDFFIPEIALGHGPKNSRIRVNHPDWTHHQIFVYVNSFE